MAYQNINQYNYPKLKLKIVYDGQDMSIASDEKDFNEEVVFSPYLIAQTYGKKLPVYYDIDNPLTWVPKNLTYKNYDKTNIFVSQNYWDPEGLDLSCFEVDTACDIGLTGIDNGLVDVMTGKTITFTNGLFNDFLKFQRLYFDRRLKLFQVTGYTGTYNRFSAITDQTLYEVVSKDNPAVGKYHELYGGFYQGFYQLFGYDYDILPQRVNKGWTVEMLLKPRLFNEYEPGPGETTLNQMYPKNKNTFFYWGTRAENKFYHYANGSPWNYSGYTRVTTPLYNCIETCACCNTGVTNSRCIYVYPPRSQNNQHDPHVNYGCNVCNGNATPQCGCSCGQLPCLECGWECQTHTCAPASPTPTPTPTITPTSTITPTPTPTPTPTNAIDLCCPISYEAPFTGSSVVIEGVTISGSGTGSIQTYSPLTPGLPTCLEKPLTYTNSIKLGDDAPPYNLNSSFSYTMTFATPINNLMIFLIDYTKTPSKTESFTITTNSGITSVSACDGCCYFISGTTIICGPPGTGCVSSPFPGQVGGSGRFLISSANFFTSITITGPGGGGGSILKICDFTKFSEPTPTPSNTIENLSESISNNYRPNEIYLIDQPDFPNLLSDKSENFESDPIYVTSIDFPGNFIGLPAVSGATSVYGPQSVSWNGMTLTATGKMTPPPDCGNFTNPNWLAGRTLSRFYNVNVLTPGTICTSDLNIVSSTVFGGTFVGVVGDCPYGNPKITSGETEYNLHFSSPVNDIVLVYHAVTQMIVDDNYPECICPNEPRPFTMNEYLDIEVDTGSGLPTLDMRRNCCTQVIGNKLQAPPTDQGVPCLTIYTTGATFINASGVVKISNSVPYTTITLKSILNLTSGIALAIYDGVPPLITPTPQPTYIPPTPTPTPTPNGCIDRVLVAQVCNSNSAKDDNFEVYMNGYLIGQLDLNQNAQVGSLFIGASGYTVTQPDFVCPLSGMTNYYFDAQTIVTAGTNTIYMKNIQENDNGNYGKVQIRNYLISGDNELIDPCFVADLEYSGPTGDDFTLSFEYNSCCQDPPSPTPTPTPTPTLPDRPFVCPPDKPGPTCSPQANKCSSCGFPVDDCGGGTCSSCGCGCNQPKPNPYSSVEDTCEKDPKYDTISNNISFKLGGDPKNPTICVKVLKITGSCEVTGTCITGVTYETGCTITEICTPPIYPYCLEVNPAWLNLEHWFQLDAVWERYTYIETCDLFYYGGLGLITKEEYLQSLANNATALIAPPYTNDKAIAEKITLVQMNQLWLEQEKFRRGRLKFYINGRIFYTIEDFEEVIPRALSTDKEKQLGVPFNISWGGGTQGLHENLTFSACTDLTGNYIQDPECFPTSVLENSTLAGMETSILLEENFGGTFEGGISQFRMYVEPLGADEVKHNFKLLKDKFLMFDPDCPVCDTVFCEPNDFTFEVVPESPTPTPTATPTPTPTPTLDTSPTPTPTVTPTPTPSPGVRYAYLFIEPTTGTTDIGQWMFDGGRDFFGFMNYSQPAQNSGQFDLDMNRYVNFSGWTSGLFPSIVTQIVPQTSGGFDSFGNLIVQYNFLTTEILEDTIPVDSWYTWIIPTDSTNNQIQTEIDLNEDGNPNVLTSVGTEGTINQYIFNYTGTTIPAGIYRVYTTYPSPIFKLTNTETIYFRGNEVEP